MGGRPSGINGGGGGGQNRMNHRLTIKLKSTVGIIRSFSLPYSNSRTLNPTDLRANNSPNRWICVEDICFCYQPDRKIILKTVNLADESSQNVIVPKKQDIFTKGVRQLSTSLTISSADFEKYEVEVGTGTIITTMSIKEVRSIFELGSVLGSPVDVGFSVGGRPVYFSVLNEEGCVGLEFVLASTDGEQLGLVDPPGREEKSRRPTEGRNALKGKERATPGSSRVDSTTRSTANPSPGQSAGKQPVPASTDQRGRPKLFKPADGSNQEEEEEEEDDDELDRMPADAWAQVEQQAIALSQTRKRQRLSISQSAIIDDDEDEDDDDEQLLPSQAPQNSKDQPHWKLFFD
ncbi:hypothetical protein H4Q26_003144 [Puccinia striiformis f. sp. tritici PST-130]|nr:hypothetical protein H4Q26_003144 [Puccinia striiformis f. sp. tritici PST-130]